MHLTPLSLLRLAILGLPILASAAPASADVPQPPPRDCAAGSLPRSSRTSAWCEPTTCASDAECPAYPYCATERSPCPDPEPYRCSGEPMGLCVVHGAVDVTSGACRSDADCPIEGARCEQARRCVHGPAPSAMTALRSGCGCRAGGDGRAPAGVALFALVFAALALARRTSR